MKKRKKRMKERRRRETQKEVRFGVARGWGIVHELKHFQD